MSDHAELVASMGVCPSCGCPVLVWALTVLDSEGVLEGQVVVCEQCAND